MDRKSQLISFDLLAFLLCLPDANLASTAPIGHGPFYSGLLILFGHIDRLHLLISLSFGRCQSFQLVVRPHCVEVMNKIR